jgi:hypothetical protein
MKNNDLDENPIESVDNTIEEPLREKCNKDLLQKVENYKNTVDDTMTEDTLEGTTYKDTVDDISPEDTTEEGGKAHEQEESGEKLEEELAEIGDEDIVDDTSPEDTIEEGATKVQTETR